MLNTILRLIVQGLLRLRYRIVVTGLEEIRARGECGILFLPAHPALIDPIIVVSTLNRHFAPRIIADRDATDMPGIRWLAARFGVRTIPSVRRYGQEVRPEVERVMAKTRANLRDGANLVLYPAGRILRSRREELGSNSAVETILREVPGARVVLLRTRGLWGSAFGEASGKIPDVGKTLKRGFLAILANGIFFTPRRTVTLEFFEPDDLPRTAERAELNAYLEKFYNKEPLPQNTYVPYTIWEGRKTEILPEPQTSRVEQSVEDVPAATREIVTRYLRELSGVSVFRDDAQLVSDLGLDSLARAEMMAWLEKEFAFPASDTDSLLTVADVLLAASGEAVARGKYEMNPPPAKWFTPQQHEKRVAPAGGETIAEVFLRQAASTPARVIVADQTSGAKSYRELITGILALLPAVKALEGERVGIMLPASVAATVAYLTVLFAGKTPVMVNWTVGTRNMRHSLDLVGVQRVITAQKLLVRLQSQGMDLDELRERFVFLESLAAGITTGKKLGALLGSYLGWGRLRKASISPIAAILFTSGSESLPKAVPLTHSNLLTNLRDVFSVIDMRWDDRLLGMLPPFHSFGLTGNMLAAVCCGLQTVFHANPTEGGMLARIIEAYQASVVIGTPTFLNGILRSATKNQLSTLRLAVTGAEECPPRVYQVMNERCPRAVILEGYGITECSPIVSVNLVEDPRECTIGRLLPSLKYALIDVESGLPVPPGASGMLLLRGPSIFGGYLGAGAPDPFVEHDDERWYRTGDLVTRDEDGVLKFKGRLKRFVKIGGEMISLPAIEGVLQERYSTPDDDGPVLAVSASSDAERPELILFTTLRLEREVVNEHLRAAGLSALHNIRQVIIVEAIPVLGTGKTDYRALHALLAAHSA